jgi:hypothetical protein
VNVSNNKAMSTCLPQDEEHGVEPYCRTVEDQKKRGLRQVGEGKQKLEDNERHGGQGDQLLAEEGPEFAVGDVVDTFKGIEERHTNDIADGLEGGRGDGARIRYDGGNSAVNALEEEEVEVEELEM